jgi:hypothetical protein
MPEELSKLDLLIKIMGMTGSDNENQALVALRKANALLKAEGWDWERLLRAKIKVVEDPFNHISRPTAAPAPKAPTWNPQPAPTWNPPPPPPRPTYQPKPQPWAKRPRHSRGKPSLDDLEL